jgi:hypothetical protein
VRLQALHKTKNLLVVVRIYSICPPPPHGPAGSSIRSEKMAGGGQEHHCELVLFLGQYHMVLGHDPSVVYACEPDEAVVQDFSNKIYNPYLR